jgi:putative ABC transport system permease protein
MRISGAGLLIGLSAVMGTSRLLGSFLYGVEPGDPLTFVGVAVLLGTVALVACIRPAIQATAVGPIEVLKAD